MKSTSDAPIVHENQQTKSDFISYYYEKESNTDPKTIEEAMSSPEKKLWQQAIREEIKSLEENDT